MKKKILIGLVLGGLVLGLTGCNYDMWDTEYDYDYAECYLGGEYQRYEIKQWRDYDGEQIQIRAKDGKTYVVSINNCRLVSE